MPLHLIERVAVEEDGEGDAVVCLHGLGGSSNTWTPLMPALTGYRVIRPDLPGSGRSGATGGALTIEKLAECVATLCARLNVSRAHILGHSMGTIVAQHLAVAQPRLVRSLSLFGPLVAPPDHARANIAARGEKARSEGVRGMHDIALALVNASTSADTRERQPVATAYVRESLMRQDPEGYARSCAALAGTVPAAVEKIEAPVLLVTGDEDVVAPPQSVRAMAERLANARGVRTVILHRCGHWTPVERAEDCARELRSFLPAQR
ncbi:MAG TPA: alpha/beta fold hydrolase [Ramlibacter sp.]|nr:alpha/beta fold hydrolase [Ramlibacter sp.]